ncbi:precorrin-2 dehydrogenase/sirohydrochlorin ferrochelatase [Desulfitispora alkaliphila]|uniref:precorrin-2 dehydrogenase/sirohydrochlorin ferrochelatase family protein n=1 Tax=Desulfitispora alkaliphila TaxID=622674 RepID=UPI003D1B879E
MTKVYPMHSKLENKPCVVVGGGEVAERKIKKLVSAGAKVTVISPDITTEIEILRSKGKLKVLKRPYAYGDMSNFFLAICATDIKEVNQEAARECDQHNILVNVVDDPDMSSFIVPSALHRGDLTISITTGGASPGLARKIKKDLELNYGPEYEEYINILKMVRVRVMSECNDPSIRKMIFREVLELGVLELIEAGNYTLAKERVNKCLSLL